MEKNISNGGTELDITPAVEEVTMADRRLCIKSNNSSKESILMCGYGMFVCHVSALLHHTTVKIIIFKYSLFYLTQ